MKKIMFNDKYGLTQAVLDGYKTKTRRIVPKKLLECIRQYSHGDEDEFRYRLLANAPYSVGEIIAIAQRYRDIFSDPYHIGLLGRTSGWSNKMFVRAELMPRQIEITDILVEFLQDISDEDCLREGVRKWKEADPSLVEKFPAGAELYEIPYCWDGFQTPRDAFAALIDKVSGKGTWDSNPYVFALGYKVVN